ncbi:MAG: hypothetical protein AAGA08_16865 [Pseudomonadota bacterium]
MMGFSPAMGSDRAKELLVDALDRDPLHDLSSVIEQINAGHMQVWSTDTSLLITEIVIYPTGRVLQTFAAGGEMAEIVNVLRPEAEVWAKAQGCVRSLVEAPRAWSKALRGEGYEIFTYVMSKEL